jgi:rhodanese-related sulfurtransferase
VKLTKERVINLSFAVLLLLGVIILSLVAVKNFEPANAKSTFQASQSPVLKNITAKEAFKLIEANKNNPDFMILDVRTPEEFSSGHLEDAVNINYYSINFQNDLAKLDKTKTYLIYCRSGNRSGKSLNLMKQLGFIRVYNISGGILQWEKEGYRITQ